MTIQNIGLFQAMGARMSYLSQRQKLLSQNVANADTPDYRPADLKPADFSSMLGGLVGQTKLQPATTDPMHLSGVDDAIKPKVQNQKTVYEISPSGNAVSLEEQMVKETQTTTDYNLMTSLYEKNTAMLESAIDRSGPQ